LDKIAVTPFAGVRIEIQKHEIGTQTKDITLFMRVINEIFCNILENTNINKINFIICYI